MNKLLSFLTILGVVGCTSVPVDITGRNSGSGAALAAAGPRYEHQLDTVYTDGATPFLRLVEVQDP